jgi:hypothetical protein
VVAVDHGERGFDPREQRVVGHVGVDEAGGESPVFDAAAEGIVHQLVPEADAEQRYLPVDGATDEPSRVSNPRSVVGLVDAGGAPGDDDGVDAVERGALARGVVVVFVGGEERAQCPRKVAVGVGVDLGVADEEHCVST